MFRPWLKNLILMAAALFVAINVPVTAALHGRFTALDVLVAVAGGAFAFWQARQYRVRTYGKTVEATALHRLCARAEDAGFQFRRNVPCPAGGDIDAVLRGHGLFVAVEIKSWYGLRSSGGRLVTVSGRPLHRDPITQCHREADSIGARPLLWLPNARRRSSFVYDGVLIINGSPKWLIQSLHHATTASPF